jgi:hypothetical protein
MGLPGAYFAGEQIGLQAFEDGLWHVQLGPLRRNRPVHPPRHLRS